MKKKDDKKERKLTIAEQQAAINEAQEREKREKIDKEKKDKRIANRKSAIALATVNSNVINNTTPLAPINNSNSSSGVSENIITKQTVKNEETENKHQTNNDTVIVLPKSNKRKGDEVWPKGPNEKSGSKTILPKLDDSDGEEEKKSDISSNSGSGKPKKK